MERNTRTIIAKLTVGDRFYKLSDKSKKVFQMVEGERKQTQYQTYKYWCCEVEILDSIVMPNNIKASKHKAIKGDTSVVYLRSVDVETK